MTWLDSSNAVTIGENVAFRPGKPDEHLSGCRLAPRPVHDLDLPLLGEVAILHQGIEALDAVGDIDEASPVGRVEHHAMMHLVDAEIGYLTDPVGYLGTQNGRP